LVDKAKTSLRASQTQNHLSPTIVFLADNSILSIAKTQPPLNNPLTVKLLTSCITTLSAWCCLPGGTRSLFGPSLLHAFYLLLHRLVLFNPDSLPPILLSEHTLLSSFFSLLGSLLFHCDMVITANMMQGRGIHNCGRHKQR
jgi:hypothetical protein